MAQGLLAGRRALVTQAASYMGPPIIERFRSEGADVVANEGSLAEEGRAASVLAEAGEIDILVANLALDPRAAALEDIDESDWQALFDVMVHPLMRLVRAVTPGMKARGRGKIVAVTSAAPLRGIAGASAYCAARGAQNAFVRAAGLELAPAGVQLNAIAQNYVRNEAYYPDELVATERFQKHLAHHVPRGRLAEPHETADLAVFLASERSDFIVAQVIPFAGGWATTTG